MKRKSILTLIGFIAILKLEAQVPNANESQFPAEGSIIESTWGNYLLSNNTGSRSLRLGVSNDSYTRGEIELVNNNSQSGNIYFKTTNTVGGVLPRLTIKDNGRVGIGTINPNALLHLQSPSSGGWLQEIAGRATNENDFVGLKILSGYAGSGDLNKPLWTESAMLSDDALVQ